MLAKCAQASQVKIKPLFLNPSAICPSSLQKRKRQGLVSTFEIAKLCDLCGPAVPQLNPFILVVTFLMSIHTIIGNIRCERDVVACRCRYSPRGKQGARVRGQGSGTSLTSTGRACTSTGRDAL